MKAIVFVVPANSEAERLIIETLAVKLHIVPVKDVKEAVAILNDKAAEAAVLIPKKIVASQQWDTKKSIADTLIFEDSEIPNFTLDDVKYLVEREEIKQQAKEQVAPFKKLISEGLEEIRQMKRDSGIATPPKRG